MMSCSSFYFSFRNEIDNLMQFYELIKIKEYNFDKKECLYFMLKNVFWYLDEDIDFIFLCEVIKNCSWMILKNEHKYNIINQFYNEIEDYYLSNLITQPRIISCNSLKECKVICNTDLFNSIYILNYIDLNFYKEKELIIKLNALLLMLYLIISKMRSENNE